jgi:hypothetical protein
VYVNAMDPATGVATWSKDFGDSSAQTGLGVAVSSAAVGVIGNYLGTMTWDHAAGQHQCCPGGLRPRPHPRERRAGVEQEG